MFGDKSPWERLIDRKDGSKRRPLLIVYDEGHNLSEQQTELLAELEPDAYLCQRHSEAASNFNKAVIQPIKLWVDQASDDSAAFKELGTVDDEGNPDAQRFVTTAVSSEKVVQAQLVKKAIQFDGSTAPMEKCLDDLHRRLDLIDEEITTRRLGLAIRN